jgi:hypothetical protein
VRLPRLISMGHAMNLIHRAQGSTPPGAAHGAGQPRRADRVRRMKQLIQPLQLAVPQTTMLDRRGAAGQDLLLARGAAAEITTQQTPPEKWSGLPAVAAGHGRRSRQRSEQLNAGDFSGNPAATACAVIGNMRRHPAAILGDGSCCNTTLDEIWVCSAMAGQTRCV